MKTMIVLALAAVCAALPAGVCIARAAEPGQHTYQFTFDEPMSWADDVCPWSDNATQGWEIAKGGHPGNALRIAGAAYSRTVSYEIRTLQLNHQPGTPVGISFDFRAAANPPGSFFMLRYFDGYCTGQSFQWAADDGKHPFPPPLLDTRKIALGRGWRHFTFTTAPLAHTVITLALMVQQPQQDHPPPEPEYVDYYLDNLKVMVTLLDRLMDPDFNWHGNYGSTTNQFRRNTLAADADWCDFADQEVVETPDGDIHYTLFQFRDATMQVLPGTRHQLVHDQHSDGAWGLSTIRLVRSVAAGSLSACSWGVRQTISYAALGLAPDQAARVRVTTRITNMMEGTSVNRVQMGVDPNGGAVTRRAIWSPEDSVDIRKAGEGWSTPSLEFDRPAGAAGFTIYFRQRDGVAQKAKDSSYPLDPKEFQSAGSHQAAESFADWVMVEVVGH
jgi:hypothetical protein